MAIKKLVKKSDKKSASRQTNRPPIVAVLGHVDHGKTTLISKIYQIDLTKKEHGGISQHIGAYQKEFKGKKITFLDTPGHVAFSKMRTRGATVADLVVLVVAADEGVKPQTLESLKHIRTAKASFLVAINKIDLSEANIERTKKDLAKNNILVEGYGGDIVAVPVSAKTGKGIDQLLEMILLLGEMAELKADPKGKLEAVVIESKLDSKKGPLATVLVRNGSLEVGEEIIIDEAAAKIKAMFDEKGKQLKFAGPGQPVEVLGFSKVPSIGAKVEKKGERLLKSIPISVPKKAEAKPEIKEDEEKKLKIILKTDVVGTLEAILGSLSSEVKIIHSEVGNITESNVLLADTVKAEIVGFNVKIPGVVQKLAETEGVKIKTYQIIYDLLEDIEKKVLRILEPRIDEEILGKAEVIAEFKIKDQRIAGSKVKEGQITKQDKLHLLRGEQIVGDCRIKSMRKSKMDVEKAEKGEEFGAIFSPELDFTIGDVLISYRKVDQNDG